jgi:hypothetical protein
MLWWTMAALPLLATVTAARWTTQTDQRRTGTALLSAIAVATLVDAVYLLTRPIEPRRRRATPHDALAYGSTTAPYAAAKRAACHRSIRTSVTSSPRSGTPSRSAPRRSASRSFALVSLA